MDLQSSACSSCDQTDADEQPEMACSWIFGVVYVEVVGVTFGSMPAATASITHWDAFGLKKFAKIRQDPAGPK